MPRESMTDEEDNPLSDSERNSSSSDSDEQGEQSFRLDDDDDTPRSASVNRRLKTLLPRGSSVWAHSRTSSKRGPAFETQSNARRIEIRDRPISCFCTADSYNVQDIYQHVSLPRCCCQPPDRRSVAQYMLYGGNPEIFDDVIHVRQPHPATHAKDEGGGKPHPEIDIFFFPYGVYVAWGVGFQVCLCSPCQPCAPNPHLWCCRMRLR